MFSEGKPAHLCESHGCFFLRLTSLSSWNLSKAVCVRGARWVGAGVFGETGWYGWI